MKVSVCMATYNGESYIIEQINSIVKQLNDNDELIIVDDKSTDNTINLIKSLNLNNLKLIVNDYRLGVVQNFNKCLSLAVGDIIFLSDQDDIWYTDKVEKIKTYLSSGYDCVVSNISLIDNNGKIIQDKVYNKNRRGLIKNIISNNYLGCAMAFNKHVLNLSLPIPKNIPMHDIWIGNVAAFNKKVLFIDLPLVYYRRHNTNASPTLTKSNNSLYIKIKNRLIILYNLILRKSSNV